MLFERKPKPVDIFLLISQKVALLKVYDFGVQIPIVSGAVLQTLFLKVF